MAQAVYDWPRGRPPSPTLHASCLDSPRGSVADTPALGELLRAHGVSDAIERCERLDAGYSDDVKQVVWVGVINHSGDGVLKVFDVQTNSTAPRLARLCPHCRHRKRRVVQPVA